MIKIDSLRENLTLPCSDFFAVCFKPRNTAKSFFAVCFDRRTHGKEVNTGILLNTHGKANVLGTHRKIHSAKRGADRHNSPTRECPPNLEPRAPGHADCLLTKTHPKLGPRFVQCLTTITIHSAYTMSAEAPRSCHMTHIAECNVKNIR